MRQLNVKRKRTGIPIINQANLDDPKIKEFIRNQIYTKGFPTGVSANATAAINIQLGGTARQLYGLCVWISNANIAQDDTFSLRINNETIIDTAIWRAYNPVYNQHFQQFFALPRPLSGSDAVTLSWTSIAAGTIYPVFYLSNSELVLQ